MEAQLVSEFVSRTGANTSDALSCLNSWGWDLKKALIDYNDTSTTDYFNDRASGVHPAVGAESVEYRQAHPIAPTPANKPPRQPSLTKTDSIDVVDYKKLYRGISRATDDNVHLVQNARSAIAMDFHTNCYKQPPGLDDLVRRTSANTSDDTTTTTTVAAADHQSPPRRHPIDVDPQQQLDSPDYTFTLPDLSLYSPDFRRFLERDLIEGSTLSSLEQAQRLNWWAAAGYCRRLWPLSTSGDGNCLLHAASLALWGFHDRKLTLRTALHSVLTPGRAQLPRDALWRRWRFQQTRLNRQAGFVYSEAEWTREWEDIVALASPEPRQSPNATSGGSTTGGSVSRRRSMVMADGGRSNGGSGSNGGAAANGGDSFDEHATYESLEEIHIFALAHVLRRTIIVVADTVLRDMNGEAMAPIPFGGVYLPFEIAAGDCHRAPLLLTYDMAHFSALVSMEETPSASAGAADTVSLESAGAAACIPLLDIDNVLLPIQFCIDPGEGFAWSEYDGSEGNWALTDREHIALLREYLDVVHVSPLGSPDEELGEEPSDEEFEGGTLLQQQHQLDATTAVQTATTAAEANGKSKAAKQLQSVAKQFGSIGKSMSKKIKKNIGSIAKIGQTPASAMPPTGGAYAAGAGDKNTATAKKSSLVQSFNRRRILCAQLKAKRYDYQEEMIRNYLECAQDRFLDAERAKQQTAAVRDSGSDHTDGSTTGGGSLRRRSPQHQQQQQSQHQLADYTDPVATCCINAGCQNFGTAATSYMCVECFEKQKEQELNSALLMDPVARYGAGNSRFYTQSDQRSHAQIQRIPSVKRLNELDQTLYLSNSTFYNDQRNQPNAQQQHQLHQDAVEQQYLQNGFRTASSYGTPQSTTFVDDADRPTHSQQRPLGSASVYSPGRTIIHHIVRQTVELPPAASAASASATASVADAAQLVPRAAYGAGARHSGSVATAMGGIATPFGQARTCRTDGCMFYGSASSDYYCSKCCLPNGSGGRTSYGNSGGGGGGNGTVGSSGTYSKVLTDV